MSGIDLSTVVWVMVQVNGAIVALALVAYAMMAWRESRRQDRR